MIIFNLDETIAEQASEASQSDAELIKYLLSIMNELVEASATFTPIFNHWRDNKPMTDMERFTHIMAIIKEMADVWLQLKKFEELIAHIDTLNNDTVLQQYLAQCKEQASNKYIENS